MFGHGIGNLNSSCWPGTFMPGPWGFILTLLFWGLVIYLFVLFISNILNTKGTSKTSSSNEALKILNNRYALGEINRDEFEQMKAELS